jgi:serine/threonine protein kinase
MEVLGSGGMAVVYKARQPTLGREVAVKLLRDTHVGDTGQRDRFVQEARAVARLQHPHLVQLYEYGEVRGADRVTSLPYLVMEYVAGGSLADLLRRSRLLPGEAARLVESLAEAIHHAHQQGIIHRDLKPSNILLQKNEGGRMKEETGKPAGPDTSFTLHRSSFIPKVTDFGLTKFLTGTKLTQTGDVLGTPCYMAPEQTVGKSGVITVAVDVYGLGAILYEALCGRPPFGAATMEATVRQVQEEDPLPLRQVHNDIPRDLETICLKCLRKEAVRRYATAQELAEDLRRFRAEEPIRGRPVGSGERVLGWCRSKPLVAGLLSALTLVFVGGISGVLWQWHRASQKTAEAERSAADFKRQQELAYLEQERADRNLRRLQEKVDRLTQLGQALGHDPRLHQTALSLLEEALTFYAEILPEKGLDPRMRQEAARMYGEIANTYHSLGHWVRPSKPTVSRKRCCPACGRKSLSTKRTPVGWRGVTAPGATSCATWAS